MGVVLVEGRCGLEGWGLGWGPVGQCDGVVQARHVPFGGYEGDGNFSRDAAGRLARQAETQDRVRAPLGVDGEGEDFRGVEVFPPADLLRRCRLGENGGVAQRWVQLAQRCFMAMIRLFLRDEDDIRGRDLREVVDG